MKIKFGDKTIELSEALQDGLIMVMEEIMNLAVEQNPEEDINFQWGNAIVGDLLNSAINEKYLSIRLLFGPTEAQRAWQDDTFMVETEYDSPII